MGLLVRHLLALGIEPGVLGDDLDALFFRSQGVLTMLWSWNVKQIFLNDLVNVTPGFTNKTITCPVMEW